MRIKFFKNQSWKIQDKIYSFKKDEVVEVSDSVTIKDIISLGYGEEVKKEIAVEEKKVIDNYDAKKSNRKRKKK